MDPLERADQLLTDALLRRPDRVVPSSATSPMDDRLTLKIPQQLIDSCEPNYGYLDEQTLAILDREAARQSQLEQMAGGKPGPARFRLSG